MSYTPDDEGNGGAAALKELAGKGPALVVRSGGGRAGESFFPSGERTLIGRSPECDVFLDDVTVSRRARGARPRRRALHDQRPRQPERDLRQQEADRVDRPRGRRRGADRQVPPDLPAPMTTTTATERREQQQPRLHTIGAVCARLQPDYPDISISKIRYLEDQGLLTPKRTRGRLPAVQRGGRRAAGDDPAPAARRVPAAPGDPPGARDGGRCGRAEAAAARGPRRRGGRARPRRALPRARASTPRWRASSRSTGC